MNKLATISQTLEAMSDHHRYLSELHDHLSIQLFNAVGMPRGLFQPQMVEPQVVEPTAPHGRGSRKSRRK